MKTTIAIGAAAGLLLLAAGLGIGRYTAPARVEYRERVVTKSVEVAAKQKEESRAQVETTNVREATKWRIRYVRRPDGTVVETAEGGRERGTEKASAREDVRREAEVRIVEHVKEVERVKIVEGYKPRFMVGAQASAGLDGRVGYGPMGSWRFAGPLELFVAANVPGRALMVGLGLGF